MVLFYLRSVKLSAKAMQYNIVFLKITSVFYQSTCMLAPFVSFFRSSCVRDEIFSTVFYNGLKSVAWSVTVNLKNNFKGLDVSLI